MSAVELSVKGSIQSTLKTTKGVYRFTMKNGDVYVGQANGLKGFAQRVKTSLREVVRGTSKKAAKAKPGSELIKVEFFKTGKEQTINQLENVILKSSGKIGDSHIINVIQPPKTP